MPINMEQIPILNMPKTLGYSWENIDNAKHGYRFNKDAHGCFRLYLIVALAVSNKFKIENNITHPEFCAMLYLQKLSIEHIKATLSEVRGVQVSKKVIAYWILEIFREDY